MTTFIMSNPFLFAVAVLQLCAFGWYWRHGALLWGLLQAGYGLLNLLLMEIKRR